MTKHTDPQQYYFYMYAYSIYAHPLLKALIKKFENGRSLLELIYTRKRLLRKTKKEGFEPLLFTYLLLSRKEKDGYVTNLIKEMSEDSDLQNYDSKQSLIDLAELLEYLELPPLQNDELFKANYEELFPANI